jgi:MSHA biogenesis protein MshJ
MTPALRTLLDKGDALSVRERSILFVLLLAAIWAVADLGFMTPLHKARQAETARIQAAQARIQTVQDSLATQAGNTSPDQAARERLAAARTAFNQHMADASRLQAHMVPPAQMVRVLQDLTRAKPGLRLVELHSLPPQGIGPEPNPGGLYRHGIRLTLEGSYEALVNYMAAVEKLPVRFFWERAELDARAHPELRLTLTLHTLSLEPEWLKL